MGDYIGFRHKVWMGKNPDGVRAVVMSNDGDPHYEQYFIDPRDLWEFIGKLFVLWLELSGESDDP